MSISVHFRVWACVPFRVQGSGRRAVAVLRVKIRDRPDVGVGQTYYYS
jgi:hypothetical protein